MNCILSIHISPQLREHLESLRLAHECLTGRKLSLTTMVRTALVQQYNYGKKKVSITDDELVGAVKRSLEPQISI